MGSFDFGVSLSLYLLVAGVVLCVGYGIFYWNKDAEDKYMKNAQKWEQEEKKINEDM
jgi:hypothetical protein